MRIAVCGPNRNAAISEIEKNFNVSVKSPWATNGESASIIDYAAETYKYQDEKNVVFDGSAFDFLAKSEGEGYDDVNEQIALSSLVNLDYIVVLTLGMDKDVLKVYETYKSILPDKFYLYSSEKDCSIVLK